MPKPKMPVPPVPDDPDRDAPIMQLVHEVVPDPYVWIITPNPHFALKRPVDLIGTDWEVHLRNMLGAAKQGSFS